MCRVAKPKRRRLSSELVLCLLASTRQVPLRSSGRIGIAKFKTCLAPPRARERNNDPKLLQRLPHSFLRQRGHPGGARLFVPTAPERFATAVYSFELAHGWKCTREGTEYVCSIGEPPLDAIIIAAMKYRGPTDTMSAYEEHLRSPRPAVGRDGMAELVSMRRQIIAGTEWIEGVLRDSEVHNYETTYLAANTAEIAILITFSVHERSRAVRYQDLRSMIESLVIYQRAH